MKPDLTLEFYPGRSAELFIASYAGHIIQQRQVYVVLHQDAHEGRKLAALFKDRGHAAVFLDCSDFNTATISVALGWLTQQRKALALPVQKVLVTPDEQVAMMLLALLSDEEAFMETNVIKAIFNLHQGLLEAGITTKTL